MVKYKEKMAFTYNIQSVVHCRKFPFEPLEQEAQLMLTTGSTRLAVSRGQQTWYHSTRYI